MEANMIAFAILKIKREMAQPRKFVGWTNSKECDVFGELIEEVIGKRLVFSAYYLDGTHFTFDDEGNIRFLHSYEEAASYYLIGFSIDYLNKIFYEDGFKQKFVRKILKMYIKDEQKSLNEAKAYLNQLNNYVGNVLK